MQKKTYSWQRGFFVMFFFHPSVLSTGSIGIKNQLTILNMQIFLGPIVTLHWTKAIKGWKDPSLCFEHAQGALRNQVWFEEGGGGIQDFLLCRRGQIQSENNSKIWKIGNIYVNLPTLLSPFLSFFIQIEGGGVSPPPLNPPWCTGC